MQFGIAIAQHLNGLLKFKLFQIELNGCSDLDVLVLVFAPNCLEKKYNKSESSWIKTFKRSIMRTN